MVYSMIRLGGGTEHPSFNEEAVAGTILKFLLGSSVPGPTAKQSIVEINDIIDLTADEDPPVEDMDDEMAAELVVLIIDDNIQHKWVGIAKKIASFLVEIHAKIKKLYDGSGSFTDCSMVISILKSISNSYQAAHPHSNRIRIHNDWTDVSIRMGWLEFIHQISSCCIPTFKRGIKGLQPKEVVMFLIQNCTKSLFKNIFLNLDLKTFPYKGSYGLEAFIGDLQFNGNDITKDIVSTFSQGNVPANILKSAMLENSSIAPKQSSLNIAANKGETGKSITAPCSELTRSVSASNEENSEKVQSTIVEQPVVCLGSSLQQQQQPENMISSTVPSHDSRDTPDAMGENLLKDHNAKILYLADVQQHIENDIMQNWVTIAVTSDASFLIDLQNMISKSKDGTLDENSVTVLHQIIEALKFSRLTKADREAINIERPIYQDWNMRKICQGWRKFLFKIWQSSVPNQDKNNPREILVAGMPPNEAYTATRQFFSMCILKQLFHDLKLSYTYRSNNDKVDIVLTPKNIQATLLVAIQNFCNAVKNKSAAKGELQTKSSRKAKKVSSIDVPRTTNFKHRLLHLSQHDMRSSEISPRENQDEQEELESIDEDEVEVEEQHDDQSNDITPATDKIAPGITRKRSYDEINPKNNDEEIDDDDDDDDDVRICVEDYSPIK